MIPYIDIHTHAKDIVMATETLSLYSVRLGEEQSTPPCPFSAGIHPWDISKGLDFEEVLHELEALNAVAIGEIGLDFLYDKNNILLQQSIFEKQLNIAQRRKLPVIIHCVRAFEPIMKILKKYSLPAVIFHGYTGSVEQTRKIVESGYYISLGSVSLQSEKTIEGILQHPQIGLFLETDDSRKYISEIYSEAGIMLNIQHDILKSRIYDTFKRIFPNI